MADIEVPVLICGGSLVGMSTAMLLGYHGVPSLTIEHHRGTAIHPRAAQITQRTMEIFRSVGLEKIIREKSGEQFVQDGAIMAVETLAGKEIAYYIANLNEGIRDVSPCERVFISQSLLEPLLRRRAEELGAQLCFGTDLESFEQDSDDVTAVIRGRDTGETRRVRAQYLVAADGAHSRVRQQLGIRMLGRGAFSDSVTIYFRANVTPLLRGRNLSVIYVLNSTLRGFFRFEKPFDSGFLAVNDVAPGLTEERCEDLIRAALGENIPVEIESIMPWQAAAEYAERFQDGRIFLVGDSAHVMPPNGGFGGNTGVQDAQNLAWKLARVLKGAAKPDLLASYDAERRPVGMFTVEQAYSRYVMRTAPWLSKEGIQAVENDLDVELGYAYSGALHENPRESKARPGTRAPHVWLGDGSSTLDWFGRDYVLVTGPERADGKGRVLADYAQYGMESSGSVLVRPDGFVDWRARNSEEPSGPIPEC